MEENPLDLEAHDEDTFWDVWKRRILFGLLIVLCVTFAAPSFKGCTDALGGRDGEVKGRYRIGGVEVAVKEREFYLVRQRLAVTYEFLRRHARGLNYLMLSMQGDRLEDTDVWAHILGDAAAREAGIEVSIDEVGRRLLKDIPDLSRGGVFDAEAYDRMIAQMNSDVTHKDVTRTLQEYYRRKEYERLLFGHTMEEIAFGSGNLVPTEDAFERWRDENERVSAGYVVQPYAPLAAAVEERTPSAEELQKFIGDKAEYRVPPRKIVETAYLRLVDVTDAQYAAMKDFVVDHGLVEFDDESERDAALARLMWPTFWTPYSAKRLWTKEQWLQWKQPEYEAAKKLWDEAPEGSKPTPEAPKSPESLWSDDLPTNELFVRYWKDVVGREALGRLVLEDMAKRAQTEQKSFADLLPEYSAYGVRVAVNEKALTDADFIEQYPLGLAQRNELRQAVANYLRGPSGDATFTPEVHTATIPLTQYEGSIVERGWIVARLAGFEKSRPKDFDEIREDATRDWRRYQVDATAREVLDGIRKSVKAAVDALPADADAAARLSAGTQALDAAAQAAGLRVRRIVEFNNDTARRSPPILPAEGEVSPEVRAIADDIRYERFVMDRYRDLRALDAGAFLPVGVLLDSPSQAGYLIRLVGKRKPDRFEADETSLENAKRQLRSQEAVKIRDALGYENLEARFQLEIPKKEETP